MSEDREIEELQKEIERLQREKEEIREEYNLVRDELEQVKGDLDRARREYDRIKKEYEEYKMRHPESAGVKHGRPYFLKSASRSPSRNRPGARKGHKPHLRPMPQQIDEVRMVPVESCPHCGGTDLSDVQEIREHVFEEIPVCRPIAVKLEVERKYCRTCRRLVEAQQSMVLPNARIGLRAMLTVVWLKVGLRMTESAIPQVLHRLFGLRISEGEVVQILAQVAKAFGPYYDELVQEIRSAPARNMDETSWRIDGENCWLWAFITKGEALYTIASKRNSDVPDRVLGKHRGVDIHDRFSAYNRLGRKSGNPQQYCWAHILNDAKELSEFWGADGEHIYQVLSQIYTKAKSFEHRGTDADIEQLIQQMKSGLDYPYSSHHCHKFVKNLLKEEKHLFEFVKNPDVDGTNNAAERAIRPAVVARKISGGNRSPRGAENYEVLLSVIQTFHLQGLDLLTHGPRILLTSHG